MAGFAETEPLDVLIENGRIAAIGSALSAGNALSLNAQGMILMPGMVDGHRRLWQAVLAGGMVLTDPRRYRAADAWKQRAAGRMSATDFEFAGMVGGIQAIDSGVTTVLDYAEGPDTVDKAMAAARGAQRSGISGVHAVGPGMVPRHDARGDFAAARRVRDAIFPDHTKALRFGVALGAPGNGADPGWWKTSLAEARALSPALIALCTSGYGRQASAHGGESSLLVSSLSKAGLLGPDVQLVHAKRLDAGDLAKLIAANTTICTTPTLETVDLSEGRSASVHGRARAAGVAAGIGTGDSSAINGDFFEAVRLATSNMYLSNDSAALAQKWESHDSLDFATRLGARAIGMGATTGSIEVGKMADLVMLRSDRFGFAQRGTLADRVVGFANVEDIDSVWVGGVRRKASGAMLGTDWHALKNQMGLIQERIGAAQA